jgi:two-component system cell cycle sensor histidine kinase/response regulator CckA
MTQLIRILYVDDAPLDRELVRDALEKEHGGFELIEAASRVDFEARFAQGGFDLVLSDFNILGFEGLQVLETVRATDPNLPVIIVTGTGSEEVAAEAIKRGAIDYVIKTPKHIQRLPYTIHAVLEKKRLADERRQINEALRESQEKFKYIFDHSVMGKSITLPSGELQVNKAFGDMLGYTQEELQNQRWQDITHPDDIESSQRAIDVLLSGEQNSARFTKRYFHKNGSIVWVDVSTSLRRDKAGKPIYFITSLSDITERKQTEDALRLQSAALNAAASAIVITDRTGLIQWVNPAFCDLTGYTTAEAIGKNPRELVKSDHHDQTFYQNLWKTILAGQVWRDEIINRRKDGSLYTEEETITPVQDAPGEINHFIAIKQDITGRKALEAENQKLTEQFYQSQKMESIGNLAGGIAHDFNNLLVPIVGYAELGMMAASPGSKFHTHFQQIKEAGERAANLTRQILAFSRRQTLEMKMVDLNQVMIEFEKMLRRLIGENISLNTHLAADLPAIEADPGQLEQVLLNLVVNARDAMPHTGRLTIETAGVVLDEAYVSKHPEAQPGLHVMLAVSDTGYGMDAATRQHIFEPFFTTKPRGHGTGLGLSTVFGIVKQHGGNIWVYSEPGQGTTIKVYIPAAETLTPSPQLELPASELLEGTETILVVEDETAVRELVSSTLQAYGYRVMEADDPDRGLELATAHQGIIHLLLTDVIMPGMNGRQLFQQLVATRPELKVLYMSGYTDNAIVHYGVLDEGVTFLQKPFTIHHLLQKVRAVLA